MIHTGWATESPDGVWSSISGNQLVSSRTPEKPAWIEPERFSAFSLNRENLETVLAGAKNQQTDAPFKIPEKAGSITLPDPRGNFVRFRYVESNLLGPKLKQKYPEIRTYRGVMEKNPRVTARFDISRTGFRAQVFGMVDTWYVDPYYRKSDTHISYYLRDYRPEGKTFRCMVKNRLKKYKRERIPEILHRTGSELRTYRLVIACTGEYSQAVGSGSEADAQAAITTTVNRVTGLYEQELAISFTLVETVIYTDGTTDPFSNDDAVTLIDESREVISNEVGIPNFDIGHTFSTGAGGVSYLGVVCDDSSQVSSNYKGGGVTGRENPTGDAYDVDYVCHEIGHQFNANHTYNGTDSSCYAEHNHATAFEPGSGSTIMGYAGICGNDNLQPNTDPIFHSASHDEIVNYVTLGQGNKCGTVTDLSNVIPVVDAGPDYTVPAGTAFVLSGSATDSDVDDVLTYLWEEHDAGTHELLSSPDDGTQPLFRVWTPKPEPVRYLPGLKTLAGESDPLFEKIPRIGRTLNFRLVVRDGKGGYDYDDMNVTVKDTDAPFVITSTSDYNSVTREITVNWDVSSTDSSPYNVSMVNLYLSTDRGLTYDMDNPLAENTPNDGSQTVTLPDTDLSNARIMIKSVGHIIFDVSDLLEATDVIVKNNGFEDGAVDWTQNSSNSLELIYSDAGMAHSGNYFAWLGGLNNETGYVEQQVVIPDGSTSLTFWFKMGIGEANSYFQVLVDGNEIFKVTHNDEETYQQYQKVTLDISAYADDAGHTIRFYSENDGNSETDFFVDDIAVERVDILLTPGDFDGSGVADVSDLVLGLKAISGFGESIEIKGDADGDGIIDLTDILYVIQKVSEVRK